MADTVSKDKRSYIMSRVRSKNTKPEIIVRKYLHSNGFRYRIHVKSLPGKPDLILPKYKTVVFVHGCFWHGHTNCKKGILPKSRIEYWEKKINGNKERDQKHYIALKKEGWKIIEVWECELKKIKAKKRLERLVTEIKSNMP